MSARRDILCRSADRVASHFSGRPKVILEELGAGYGDAAAVILSQLERHTIYPAVKFMVSDGFAPVVEAARRNPRLAPFVEAGKVEFRVRDFASLGARGEAPDYMRISYALTDLPRVRVEKEGQKVWEIVERGYISGEDPIVGAGGEALSPQAVARALATEDYVFLLRRGIDIRHLKERVVVEEKRVPCRLFSGKKQPRARQALVAITTGVNHCAIDLPVAAADALARTVVSHLSRRPGSLIEVFDLTQDRVMDGLVPTDMKVGLTGIASLNVPFISAYLAASGLPVSSTAENWTDYLGTKEQHIHGYGLHRLLKNRREDEVAAVFGRRLWGQEGYQSWAMRILAKIKQTDWREELMLESEIATHPMFAYLTDEGFTAADIAQLFLDGRFSEQYFKPGRGHYWVYQILSIEMSASK
jgi:hypothetical protein